MAVLIGIAGGTDVILAFGFEGLGFRGGDST